MHKDVETTLGRLATDTSLRRCFTTNPAATLAKLAGQGLELNEVELQALAATDPKALEAFAVSLDRRLVKAAPVLDETETGLEPTCSDPGERPWPNDSPSPNLRASTGWPACCCDRSATTPTTARR